jgi:serine/threonine-protein kinase HipA
MATSSSRWPNTAFVWTWLPGETEPVVAGAVEQSGPLLRFA